MKYILNDLREQKEYTFMIDKIDLCRIKNQSVKINFFATWFVPNRVGVIPGTQCI